MKMWEPPKTVAWRNFLPLGWYIPIPQQFVKFVNFLQFMAPVASAPGKLNLTMFLCTCLSLQIQGGSFS